MKCRAIPRGEAPFRILLRRGEREWYEEADMLLDCTGTFLTPNHLGEGGIPALGEAAGQGSITYGVADVLGRLRWMFENRRIMVVGAGYSAATAVRDLALLRKSAPDTSITWLTRGSLLPPCRAHSRTIRCRSGTRWPRRRTRCPPRASVDFRHDCTVIGIRAAGPRLEVTLSQLRGPGDRHGGSHHRRGRVPAEPGSYARAADEPARPRGNRSSAASPPCRGGEERQGRSAGRAASSRCASRSPAFSCWGQKASAGTGLFSSATGATRWRRVFNYLDAAESPGASLVPEPAGRPGLPAGRLALILLSHAAACHDRTVSQDAAERRRASAGAGPGARGRFFRLHYRLRDQLLPLLRRAHSCSPSGIRTGRRAMLVVLVSAIVWWWADWKAGHPYFAGWVQIWETTMRVWSSSAFSPSAAPAIKNYRDSMEARMVDMRKMRELEREIVNAGEREQQRIGQDLHDGLCQYLAGHHLRGRFTARRSGRALPARGGDRRRAARTDQGRHRARPRYRPRHRARAYG